MTTTTADTRKPARFLRVQTVMALTDLGRSTIYDLERRGRFPARVRITPRAVRWVESEIEAWINNGGRP